MARLPVRLGLACHCSVHFLGAFAPGREILYLFGYLLLNFLRLLGPARIATRSVAGVAFLRLFADGFRKGL
jgi:hypothetical protein